MNDFAPNLRHLRAFREVARCRSISLASKEIFLSQPAITQAIAKLEATLQVSLFERRREGMFTTAAGELFLDRIDRVLNLIQKGAKEAFQIGIKKSSKAYDDFDRRITIIQLRALTAVSDAGNFSLAARSIGVTQPSLHRAARDLEYLAGMTLFMKARHGIEISAAANSLVMCAKLAFSELEQGISEIAEWRGLDSGEIVIGTMPLARSYILPKAINQYTRVHPEAKLRVVDGPYDDLLHGLRHGDIDFLVGALRSPEPADDVEQEALFDESLKIVVRSGHPLANQADVSAADLARYPWVVPRENTPTRNFFETIFQKANIACPDRLIETSSVILMRSLLLESDRIALVSTHQVILEEKMGVLVSLAFLTGIIERPIGLTLRREWRPTAKQKEFLDLIRSAGEASHDL